MKNRNENKQIICAALGWQEVDHQLYQFETGMVYLEVKMGLAERVSAISRTQSWWMWWQRQWDMIDRKFVIDLGLSLPEAENYAQGIRYDLLELYRLEHSPADMHVYPSRQVKRLIEDEHAKILQLKIKR